MKRVDIDPYSKQLIVKFRFLNKDINQQLIMEKRMKTLYKKKYSQALKCWLVPATVQNITKLYNLGFSFPPDFAEAAQNNKPQKKEELPPYLKIKVPKYLSFLRPYQKIAFQFLKYNNGRALIGDSMGIGKTIEALGWIKSTIKEGPALIIVPTSTKLQWLKEYTKYIDNNIKILYGRKAIQLFNNNSYIINWEILYYWQEQLSLIDFKTVVADECQYAGNTNAKRTKALKNIAKKIKYFIPMSGTPINSKTLQFFPILNLLDPQTFYSEWKFKHRYCDPKHNGFSMTYNGASHTEELHEKISKIMIRRYKRDVLKDLPPLIRSIVPMQLTSGFTKYKDLEQYFFETFDPHNFNKIEMENKFHSLKLQVFDLKLKSIIQWIDDFLKYDKKIIIGVWHKYVIETLFNKYKNISAMINGSVTGNRRQKALNDFYMDKTILFLQLKSGGVGLDGLQKVCHNAAFVELGDTPTIMDQFESRLERSGQTEPTNIFYLVGEGTIEQDVMEVLDEVRTNINAVVDGGKVLKKNLLELVFERRSKING